MIPDPALDRVMASVPHLRGRGPWKLVRDPARFPRPGWLAACPRAKSWGKLYAELVNRQPPGRGLVPRRGRHARVAGSARSTARVQSWDGRTAIVEHDGSCILILRRTYYPGWSYRVDGGPEQPVLKVNGGLHGVPLTGPGPATSSCDIGRPAWREPGPSLSSPSPPPVSSGQWSGVSGQKRQRVTVLIPRPLAASSGVDRFVYLPGLSQPIHVAEPRMFFHFPQHLHGLGLVTGSLGPSGGISISTRWPRHGDRDESTGPERFACPEFASLSSIEEVDRPPRRRGVLHHKDRTMGPICRDSLETFILIR